MNILKTLARNITQIPGWHTHRKIVVIESDDWGSIRMSSKNAYKTLLKSGIAVDKDPYNKYDSLETEDDLTALFDTLKKFKDKSGKRPVITANTIVANPDFEKIRQSDFRTYHYEDFTKTLNRYSGNDSTFDVWKAGVNEGFFRPQFHGREHVNVGLWMKALQASNKDVVSAFEQGVFGIPVQSKNNIRGNYMAAFDYHDANELSEVKGIISEGLKIFKELFGYDSETIIAPCYILPDEIMPLTNSLNVKGYQGISYQYSPVLNEKGYKRKFRYTGQSNDYRQRYLVRNAFFEPTLFQKSDVVEEILQRMRIAFFWNKPLIIGTHRINFMGGLEERNRTDNLQKFEQLFTSILKACPQIEFMSSDQLIKLMLSDKK
jgi:hypothetical protein